MLASSGDPELDIISVVGRGMSAELIESSGVENPDSRDSWEGLCL